MNKSLITAITLLTASTLFSISGPADAARSSYQKTCKEISISGNVLSANCRRRDGSYNQTSIVLRGIENIDGVLKVTDPNRDSNYQLTCDDIHIRGDKLSAVCKRRDQQLHRTSIILNGIENIDGVLEYTSNP